MKVLFLTHESIGLDPILSSQVFPLLDRLASKGLVLTLMTFEPNVVPISSQRFVIKQVVSKTKAWSMLRSIFFLLLKGGNFDVIHARSYPAMFLCLISGIFLRRKVIFDPRGVFCEEIKSKKKISLVSIIFKVFEPLMYRSAHAVIVVSDGFKRYVLDKFLSDDSRIKVIPTFSNNFEFHGELAPHLIPVNSHLVNRVVICYSGSLEPWQRFDDVVKLFGEIRKKNIGVFFLILAKNKEYVVDKLLQEDIGPDEFRVVWATQEELASYLNVCDYGVVLREDNLINRVASPIKIKDYLASGLKLILTRGVSEFRVLVKRGFDVTEISLNNIESSAEKAELTKLGQRQRASYIENAEEFYSVDTSVRLHLELYNAASPVK